MRYHILQDFKGSQTGATTEQFTAGTQADLTDYLAACLDSTQIRPAAVSPAPTLQIDNKAITTEGPRPKVARAPKTR